jgi:hypothetical protein
MLSRKQRGQALFIALLLLAAGIGAWVFYMADPSRLQRSSDEKTAAALAQAKEALIGWRLNDSNRPGVLPCPDTNDDGTAEAVSGVECPSYIGRLPWKTLGLSELRDGTGETLWYAMSRNFRNDASAEPVNTDTKGTLTVYSQTTATILTSQAVAVIFAPGTVLGNQDRSSSVTASCSAPAGTIVPSRCAANYLDTASSTNNAAAAGPFITAQATASFNDKLLIVSAADVMIPVEKRAAREIINLLQLYKTYSASGCNCYPWADISDGVSNPGSTYGRVPLLGASPTNWSSLPTPIAIAPWLINNRWWWVFFYNIADSATATPTSGKLGLNGVPNIIDVVLITTGTAGASRPRGSPGSWSDTWWTSYVDDSNNSDLGINFFTPSSTAYDRDRIYTLLP